MIDIMKMGRLMEEQGFSNITMQSEYAGVPFPLTGDGRAGARKLKILVKNIKALDDAEVAAASAEYALILKRTTSIFLGSLSLYCLLADSIDGNQASLLIKKVGEIAYSSAVRETCVCFILADCSRKMVSPIYPPLRSPSPLFKRYTYGFETKIRKVILDVM